MLPYCVSWTRDGRPQLTGPFPDVVAAHLWREQQPWFDTVDSTLLPLEAPEATVSAAIYWDGKCGFPVTP